MRIASGGPIAVGTRAGQELHRRGHVVRVARIKPERLIEQLRHRRQHALPREVEVVSEPTFAYEKAHELLGQGDVPEAARKHVPRYPLVSATLIGRLAVATGRQGEGFGAILLADAVQRAYASANTVGSSMLVVDALGTRAAAFYEANGFLRLPDSLRLILPMSTIRRLLG